MTLEKIFSIATKRRMISLLVNFFAIVLINGELTEPPVSTSSLPLTTILINTEKMNEEQTTMPSILEIAFRGPSEGLSIGAIISAPQIECDVGYKRDGNGICRPVTF
ncbi:uncharacterized protein LOC118449862 [Vespa mandarinia]|uniref:uncharacterized protein LOC118449862 n=1 Tax=Vespa mandarinia TaxID=7446 RepID=UPI00160D428D|nr:uncharacterized protein LOC118449862 [Vespa mandarinia]